MTEDPGTVSLAIVLTPSARRTSSIVHTVCPRSDFGERRFANEIVQINLVIEVSIDFRGAVLLCGIERLARQNRGQVFKLELSQLHSPTLLTPSCQLCVCQPISARCACDGTCCSRCLPLASVLD